MTPSPERSPLMPLDEALRLLGEGACAAAITDTETLSTFDALGRVLAAEVCSGLDVPPQDNTAMDGYAVRVADVQAEGTVLPVSQRIPAGTVGQPLQPGTAARIFTGAQIPAGADAVVMQERCEAVAGEAGDLGSVRVNLLPTPGLSIRRRGEDVRSGAVVLERGQRLSPQALGLAASVGAATVQVLRRPRVALFSTGDELVMPDEVPPERMPPGAIYNSNRFTLRGLLQSAGCEVTDLGIVADRLDATRQALRTAAEGHDLILTCGGVSVGDEDHVKPAVQAEGRLALWQLAIKPGKPLAFGAVNRAGGGEALFVGLPGNPVSAFITFMVAVRPVLQALQGLPATLPRAMQARAGFDWPRPDKRREFLRVRFDEASGALVLFSNQGSGVLTSTVWADGLVDNPPGQAIAKGDTVAFLPMQALVGT